WAASSAGRAPRSQRGGREFEPPAVHQLFFNLLLGLTPHALLFPAERAQNVPNGTSVTADRRPLTRAGFLRVTLDHNPRRSGTKNGRHGLNVDIGGDEPRGDRMPQCMERDATAVDVRSLDRAPQHRPEPSAV